MMAPSDFSDSRIAEVPGLSRREQIRNFLRSLTSPEHLFAGFLGFLIMLLLTRALAIRTARQLDISFLLTTYQDVLLWAAIVWAFYAFFHLTQSEYLRSVIAVVGWLLILGLLGLRMVYLLVFTAVGHPLTYQMMALSGAAVEVSFEEALRVARPMVPAAFICVLLVAEIIWLATPKIGRRLYRRFHTLPCLVMLAGFIGIGHIWMIEHPRDFEFSANPEYVLVTSYLERGFPSVNDSIPTEYFNDFLPSGRRATTFNASPIVLPPASIKHHSLNVVMVVMESVGANHLELYEAPYKSSEVITLARHGIVFEKIYAGEPESSAAMAAIFCSIYPKHSLISIPRGMTNLGIPGLPAVLAGHGYKSAFIHPGPLLYDREKDFLRYHGFAEIVDEPTDTRFSRDAELVPAALKWIKSNQRRPFFLTIWTLDTHHPYRVEAADGYDSGGSHLDRYLEAVRAADALVGRLVGALKEMNLLDDTLVVITGDHGEAFREHGNLVHGFSVYNEEVHIPLIITNPKLIPKETRVSEVGGQLDIAPTLLALLGFDIPPEWQGMSLFAAGRTDRAYLFSTAGNFTLGMVDGNFKYIYDFVTQGAQLYNLATDPGEQRDLAGEAVYSATMAQEHLRLEAWLAFQNNYLARFADSGEQPL